MEFQTDSVEAVDIPPDLQLELNSARSIDSLPSLRSTGKQVSSFNVSNFQTLPDGLSASSSSIDSLNMLVEKQRMRQLNHPQHQEHISDPQGLQADVKETNEIFLKYDPISKRKVLNTYEIIKELGLGQHGKVKLARDLLTKQLVAIKIVDRHEKKEHKFFRIKKTNSLTQSDKIKREIAIMKKCHYKHVVKLIEVLDDSKSRKIYLVLEYCSKGEVKWCPRDQMETEAHGPPLLSFQRTREIIRGVVLGLEYLHYQGVIHRDIKPANLLISGDGTVKISDFGVSLAATGSDSNESMESVDELELAKTAGTPAFFAPEICLGNEAFEKYNLKREELFKGSSISFMIDIWALGVTLYCLLFGMLPFISDYELELFEKIVNQPVGFPTYEEIKNNGISAVSCQEEYEAAKDILNKLLEKNPMKRICIPEIKKHPMVCWDFDHLSSTDNNHIAAKLEEIKEFQSNKEQQFKQILVSKRELKHAVLGVGKKIKESVFNNLPVNRRSSKGESGSVSTVASDINSKPASVKCNDSSFIVSEGSIVSNLGDVSTVAQYNNDKNYDENDNKNNDKKTNNAISSKSNGPELFKKGYSICNDNDNNDNEMTKEASQREIFEQELQKFDNKHDPKTIVNLPINSSFASLDSFYIDNYAMSKVGSTPDTGNRDPRIASSIFARPPSASAILPPCGGRRKNSNTIGNRMRNSSSRLDYFNSGIQSTRNERVPYNQSRGIQRSGRSGTDVTLQRPSVGSNMSFAGKMNGKQTLNKQNEDNRNSFIRNETESGKPATSVHRRAENSKDNAKNFQIKRGNFFSSFDGQDETSHSDTSSSGSSTYSSSSESDSESSYAESLPFEFGVDSSTGSVVSMREMSGLDQVRPFMEVHSPRHVSRKGSLDNGRKSERPIGVRDDDDDENDELVLTMGSAGHQRRQGSSHTSGSSAGSSRRNTLPYLYRGSDGAPAIDSVCTITPGNVTTINPPGWASGQQRSGEAPAEPLNSSSKSSLSSDNANISHVSIHPSSLHYSSPGSTSGSLLLPLSNVKPTTQASNVDGILSKGRHQERFHDNSRKLLKTVLITSAESDRRQSVPSLTPPARSSQRTPSSRINGASVGATPHTHEQRYVDGRPSRSAVREATSKNEIRRSRSITIAELCKNKP